MNYYNLRFRDLAGIYSLQNELWDKACEALGKDDVRNDILENINNRVGG